MTDDAMRPEPSYVDLVLWALDRFPERVALVEENRELDVPRGARPHLTTRRRVPPRGFGHGNGLMTLSGNASDALLAGLAVRTLGSWQGSLHPMGSADDQAFILDDSDALGLVFEPELYDDRARELAARLPALKHCSRSGRRTSARTCSRRRPRTGARRCIRVADADDLCSLGYSGGTTGRPKGVMQRHRTVVEMTRLICTSWQLPSDIRFLATTPISHAAVCFVLPTWLGGGTVVLQRSFDPEELLPRDSGAPDHAHVHGAHDALRVPRSSGDEDGRRVEPRDDRVRRVADGGDAAARGARRVRTGVPAAVRAGRGAGHRHHAAQGGARPRAAAALLAPCGRPLPGVTVELLDDDDKEVPVGEVGEICVRGRIVTDGYWKRPSMTAETFRNGWLHTGDMATATTTATSTSSTARRT